MQSAVAHLYRERTHERSPVLHGLLTKQKRNLEPFGPEPGTG